MGSLSLVTAEVKAMLEKVAPWSEGAAAIATVKQAPSIVWVPGAIRYVRGGGNRTNAQRVLGLDSYEVMVQLWGKTEGDVEDMRSALITALDKAVGGNYDVPETRRVQPQTGELGHKLVAQVQIRLNTLEQKLPTAPYSPAVSPETSVTNQTKIVVVLAEQELVQLDTAAGDGNIDGGEG